MSYNIDNSEVIAGGPLRMEQSARERLATEHEFELPEVNFLTDDDCVSDVDEDGYVEITNFWWYGESSENSYELLIDTILPRTKGSADIVFTWEGGDSHTAVQVRDGVVTQRDVKFSLT